MEHKHLVPWPQDFKFMPNHHLFAEKHGKSLVWLNQQLRLCAKWNKKHVVVRTHHSWNRHFTNWLIRAILFESEKAAGETAYSSGLASSAPMQPIQPLIDGREVFEHHRIYKQLLKDDPAKAEDYRLSLPLRIRKMIK